MNSARPSKNSLEYQELKEKGKSKYLNTYDQLFQLSQLGRVVEFLIGR